MDQSLKDPFRRPLGWQMTKPPPSTLPNKDQGDPNMMWGVVMNIPNTIVATVDIFSPAIGEHLGDYCPAHPF